MNRKGPWEGYRLPLRAHQRETSGTRQSRNVVEKNVHATVIPKGNMGYDQYTVPDTVAVKHTPMASPAILSNFFEEQ